ncbi:glycosyltransferase family A protein [Sphingomonas sp.]|uniref:glycosyltransferase family 2 protein n=1 Tax=Sphingomonas sp. TaxID=28214 RepID=UPI0025F409AD|nr:glycosyltransferase family A protein [Sphingomonas sp.]MBV9527255.1 glycosyltransferase family 2 protein [Sphingomonas sp.]
MGSGKVSFSVVIPLYNKGPHVERALRSVLDQQFAAAEILVVDDGSTDGGLETARRFDKVKVLTRSEPGPGGYAARNLGIDAASSEWIAFLDADDRWLPDHLAMLAAAIGAGGDDVGCAFTRPVFIQEGETRAYAVSAKLPQSPQPIDLDAFLSAWLDTGTCPMWTGAIAIRRSVLLAAGLFPAGIAGRGGDKDLWLRVMALTNALYVPKVSAEFHQDTVNRVTKSLDHSVQPIITRTIRRLIPMATRRQQQLLRRLNNMEVVFYARYAAGAGAPFNRESIRTLCRPAAPAAARIIGYAVAGRVIRALRSRRPA